MTAEPPERQRIDKWLWAARFFKTRSLAAEAAESGKVQVNGARAKPAREVRAGDTVELRVGELHWTVTVRATAPRRGPAPEAQALYEETEASRRAREEQAAQRRLAAPPGADLRGRPTKRDRRRLDRFGRGS